MSNVVTPPGEQLHRALRWINDEKEGRPQVSLSRLVEEACLRFDLSPGEEEWLLRVVTERPPSVQS